MRYRSRACQSIGCLWNTVAKSLVTTHRHRYPTPKMGKKEDPYPLVPWENLMVVAAVGPDVEPQSFPLKGSTKPMFPLLDVVVKKFVLL